LALWCFRNDAPAQEEFQRNLGEPIGQGQAEGEEEKKAEGEEAEELFETNWELEVDNFDDMGLKEEVLRGIYAFGFKEPSPIQQKGILPVIQGKDTIA
jgi:translation initiation factor 4A